MLSSRGGQWGQLYRDYIGMGARRSSKLESVLREEKTRYTSGRGDSSILFFDRWPV